jgi:RNA polymerase sigma-70 factor (ECF subfamily)
MVAVEMPEAVGTQAQPAYERSLELLYRSTYERLVLSAYALTGDVAEAQDAVQEAFVRALARPGPVLTADSPEAWLRKVSLNLARSRFRRRHRLDVLLRRVPPPPQEIPGLDPDRLAVLGAIRRLPRTQAETIALYYLADLPVDEVARALGVPSGTVKARLSRGRAALATLLVDLTPVTTSSDQKATRAS